MFTSRQHLSFAPRLCIYRLQLSVALSPAAFICTSELHMLLAPLLCTSHWHIKLSHHAYTSPLHTRADSAYTSRLHLPCALAIRISPLRFRLTSHMQRSFATLSVTSCLNLWFAPPVRNLHWHLSCAPLSFASYMQLSVAPLSWAFRKHSIFITSHMQLACAPLIRASPLQF